MHPGEATGAGGGCRALLGADLACLLDELPSPVESMHPITTLAASRSSRASFHLRLRNGSRLKARRLESAFEAERLVRLTRHLARPCIPAVIAQRGAAVLEPWTEGQPLGRSPSAAMLRRCGELLASIHGTDPPAGSEAEIRRARIERESRFASNLDRLVANGAIGRTQAKRLSAISMPEPDSFAIGLIHGDFCAENLIRTIGGQVVAIDNETLRLEALDYDLARSWYRWPMTAAQARAFLDGYCRRRDISGFRRHATYWSACALVDAAVFRLDSGSEDAALPLQLLSALAEGRTEWPVWDGREARQ